MTHISRRSSCSDLLKETTNLRMASIHELTNFLLLMLTLHGAKSEGFSTRFLLEVTQEMGYLDLVHYSDSDVETTQEFAENLFSDNRRLGFCYIQTCSNISTNLYHAVIATNQLSGEAMKHLFASLDFTQLALFLPKSSEEYVGVEQLRL